MGGTCRIRACSSGATWSSALVDSNISFRIAADYDMMLRLMSRRARRLHHPPVTAVEMAVGGISTSGLKSELARLP